MPERTGDARTVAGALWLLVLLTGACAARTGEPIVLSIPDVRASPVRVGQWIGDYDAAAVSIADILERDLGLPRVQAALYFYEDAAAFRAALEAQGYSPELARDAATALSGVGGFRRVVLNDATLRRLEWPHRIAFLAHELTHTVQYELANGRRSTSEQWLREGFAEWVEVYVIDELGLGTRSQARATAWQRVRASARRRPLPSFAEMITYPDWVRVILDRNEDAIYAMALVAADLLIERHGRAAVIEYFRLFAASEDRLDNFRLAFGEDLPTFEAGFRRHLADGGVR